MLLCDNSHVSRYLIISDLQIPFEAKGALAFCRAVQKEYKIPPENIYCVGDEVDHYFGSQYCKDPDSNLSAALEIEVTKDKLRAWYKAFPRVKVCVSNHGLRWAKKAFDAEIPAIMLKNYQDVIEAPPGWQWKYEWIVNAKHPFRVIHGLGYSGQTGHRNAAADSAMSTAIGHLHSFASSAVQGMQVWGMNTGCLIDLDSFAFHYGKTMRNKPTLGLGVVVDNGKRPIFIPYD